jgi:hypothetical protein
MEYVSRCDQRTKSPKGDAVMWTSRLLSAVMCGLGLSLVSQVANMPDTFVQAQDQGAPTKKRSEAGVRPSAKGASVESTKPSERDRAPRRATDKSAAPMRGAPRAAEAASAKGSPTKSAEASVSPSENKPRDGQLRQRDVPSPAAAALHKPLAVVPAGSPTSPTKSETKASVDDHAVISVVKPAPNRDQVKLPPPLSESDVSLRERVQRALMEDKTLTYSARSISIEARDGEITLRGELNTQFEKARVARTAGRVAGARLVHDRLTLRNPTDGLGVPVQE